MNKNRKITMTILIGLTTFSMVGCGSKTDDTAFNDVVYDGTAEVPGATNPADEISVEDDVTVDSEDKVVANKGEYTEEQIKADFKLFENSTAEVSAAIANDTFIATLSSMSEVKANDSYLVLDKEIENFKKSIDSMNVPQLKKISSIYVNLFERQGDLIDKLADGEINETEFADGIAENMKALTNEVMNNLSISTELEKLISQYELNMSDLLDPYNIEIKGTEIFEEKYTENVNKFMESVLR